MLWTLFKLLIGLWLLKLVLDLGASVVPVVLVVCITGLLVRATIQRTFFSYGRPQS